MYGLLLRSTETVHWVSFSVFRNSLIFMIYKNYPVYGICTAKLSQCTESVPLMRFAVQILIPGFFKRTACCQYHL